MAVQFAFAARSDVGLVRRNNQDSGYAGQHLLVLADGMGGPAGGDIASSVAVAHLAPLDEDPVPADEMLSRLRNALQDAHNELIDRSEVDAQLRGLGTTCIAVLRSGNKLAMVHIGDSRAYLLRDDILTQVTTDHSFVQYLIDSGQITPEEAETHPKRSVILRVLGDAPGPISTDETVREAVAGDRWLLCSDGLSGVVSRDTIAEVLQSVSDLDECAEKLIQLALLAGAPDNVTCVLADVVPAGENSPTVPQIVGAAAIDRAAPSRGGEGAAGKAAALVKADALPEDPNDTDTSVQDKAAKQTFRRRWIAAGVTFVAVVLLALIAGFGWKWSQTQYFAMGTNGNVVIYQGIPQSLGPWDFSSPIEVTDLELADLTAADRQRLNDPVTRSSLAEMQSYLQELRARAEQAAAEDLLESQSGRDAANTVGTESPSSTPNPSASPTPTVPVSQTPKSASTPEKSGGNS